MSVEAVGVSIEALRCFRGREKLEESLRMSIEAIGVSVEAVRVSIEALRCFRGRERLEEVPENVN